LNIENGELKMKDQNMKYNEVLSKLKKTEPILDDPEGLTDRIMQRVEQSSVGVGRIIALRISGMMSGVAASALICLLAYETLKYPVPPVDNDPICKPLWAMPDAKPYPQITGLDFREKEKIIKTAVRNKEAQRARKEQINASFIVRDKIIKSY